MKKDKISCMNVLMTTMSILSNKNVNYYFSKTGKRKGEYLFCDGISPLEPGTKYFLSQYPIDAIVVVGTKETITKGENADRTEYADLQEVCDEVDSEQVLSSGVSAYGLYKYRIASFLREKGRIGHGFDSVAEGAIVGNIPPERRGELRRLYEEQCEINPFLLNEDALEENAGNKNGPWDELERAIEKSIKEDFTTTNAYQKYLVRLNVIREYQEEYWKNLTIQGNAENVREAIKKNHEMSLMEKEYLYRDLQKKVMEGKLRNDVIELNLEISRLEIEVDRLQYELDAVKGQRQKVELGYVKYVAFCKLPDSNRLYPLAENTASDTHPIALRFVDEQMGEEDPVDNINGIVNALYGKNEKDVEINLYIDMQGGNRTSGYVRNAILSVLSNQEPMKVHIKEVIGTNYNVKQQCGSEIINETKRYRILDLVSGMNAFIRYGKADMIQNYCELMEIAEDSQVSRLVNCMVDVDEAISLCNIQALMEAIVKLRDLLSDEGNLQDSVDFVENVFQILKDGIKSDYGKLLERPNGRNEVNYAELISWCAKKGFIQQALTLIEDKMPTVYFERGMLSYYFENDADGEKQDAFNKTVGASYERRMENKIFYSLPRMSIDGPIFELLWHLKPTNIAGNMSGRGSQFNELRNAKMNKGKRALSTIIIDEIQRYCKSPGFKVRREQLENKVKKLSTVGQNDIFAELYCEFRRMEKDFEDREDGRRDITVPGTIYDIGKDKIKNHSKQIYYSLLGCVGTHEYYIEGKNCNVGTVHITISLHESLKDYKHLVEEAFTLHEALKLERNCSNHASEKGVRLSGRVVKRAIEIYAKDIATLFSIISEK